MHRGPSAMPWRAQSLASSGSISWTSPATPAREATTRAPPPVGSTDFSADSSAFPIAATALSRPWALGLPAPARA